MCICSYTCNHNLIGYIEKLIEETMRRCIAGEKGDSSNAPVLLPLDMKGQIKPRQFKNTKVDLERNVIVDIHIIYVYVKA